MDTNTIIAYIACICFLFVFGRIFILPIKTILKLFFNSLLGAVLIFIINLVGNIFNFHIGLNIVTAIIVGVLGIPGAILIAIVNIIVWYFYVDIKKNFIYKFRIIKRAVIY